MERDESSAPDEETVSTDARPEPESESAVEPVDLDSPSASGTSSDEEAPVVRPVSETIGTGSFFGIGCTIFALLFVCIGVAIFMWRQAN
jgi:hypothetical protein